MKRPPRARRLLAGVLTILVIASVGATGYALFGTRGNPPSFPSARTGIVPVGVYVVNLADPGGGHFLRLSLSLVVADGRRAQALADDPGRLATVRSNIFQLLTEQTANGLAHSDGRRQLKTLIASKAAAVAGNVDVQDVLFTEFVVQGRTHE